ncbi:urea ABC transporter ATP-binding subunit UrtE [Planotetraspora kaengkrachanensis]|uniref:ABC transporter ATP-binding protein n=2 Tax=Planotetraspora kaengkrachanensis TaxID=575193 RepID=A0A8J3LZ69_9ACTN|nr:ABC transporter ATP-binding protein [Planotetraspora kaengkrachanensis]
MLCVEGLEAGYGGARVLFGVSMEVGRGRLTCVMGRGGVGKTTLLNVVMGVLPASGGSVTFEGRSLTGLRPDERVRLGMGYVPHGHDTFPQLSVMGNLMVTVEASPHKDATAVDDALEVFPLLKPVLNRPAGSLSSGQQRRLAMARALVTRPRLLILDEPAEGVEASVVFEIGEAIERLRASGLAMLLVERYLDLALRLADDFVILDAGRVARSGTAEELKGEDVHRLLEV